MQLNQAEAVGISSSRVTPVSPDGEPKPIATLVRVPFALLGTACPPSRTNSGPSAIQEKNSPPCN